MDQVGKPRDIDSARNLVVTAVKRKESVGTSAQVHTCQLVVSAPEVKEFRVAADVEFGQLIV